MAVVNKYGKEIPQGSKLKLFKKYTLHEKETLDLKLEGYDQVAVFVIKGRLFVNCDGKETMMQTWQTPTDGIIFTGNEIKATTYSFAGYWMDRCIFYVFYGDLKDARIGTFRVSRCDKDMVIDKQPYIKNTLFTARTCDYEQDWLLTEGHASVRVGEDTVELAAGDMLVIEPGVRHDFSDAHEYCEVICLKIK